MAKYRNGRINEELKKEISTIIRDDIKDPRLNGIISVTRVDVTRDLRYAKVFVSIFASEEVKETNLGILKASAGFIRREVGQKVKLRYTPEIIIELDSSIERGMHIDSILQKIKEQENKNDN